MNRNYKISKHLFIYLFILCCPFFANAQTTFQKVYSSVYDQEGLDALPTDDGGYIITGFTTNDIINDMDVYIVKTNGLGNIVWTKSYGGIKPDFSNSIVKTNDGNYFSLGYSQSFGGGDYDIWLLKINAVTGDTMWTKRYGGWGNEQGMEITATNDGNFIIAGYTNSGITSYDACLIKINPAGNVIWTKNYGGVNSEWANSVKPCADGGYIMLGKTFSYGAGGGDAYLVKINSTGDTSWTKTYGGMQDDEGMSVVVNNDGTFVLCVRDSSSGAGDVDIQIIKTDMSGAVIWNKTYGGNKKDTDKMIQPTTDGGYIVTGISRSFGWINPDMWLLKLNAAGDTTWTRHYGGTDHEHCYSTRQTADGGYIAVGKTESFSSTNEIMFLKLNPAGTLSVSVDELGITSSIDIYPNPSKGIVTVNLGDNAQEYTILKLYNTLGQEVFSKTLDQQGRTNTSTIDLKEQKPGLYFLNVQSTDRIITKKIILN